MRDYGKHRVTTVEGVILECNYVAPGLTFQDLSKIFHDAEKEWSERDNWSANPGKWQNHRGLAAVTKAIVEAFENELCGNSQGNKSV